MIPPTTKVVHTGEGPGDDQPMTDEQAARLHALAERSGEPFDARMSRREAARRIAALEEIEGLN